MRGQSITITLQQPYLALLEIEARGSKRTVEAHIQHILGRRYDNVIRVCTCGYFLYAVTDDLLCYSCGEKCCPWCSFPQNNQDLCFACAEKMGLVTEGRGGFRAAPSEKV